MSRTTNRQRFFGDLREPVVTWNDLCENRLVKPKVVVVAAAAAAVLLLLLLVVFCASLVADVKRGQNAEAKAETTCRYF